MKIRLFIMTIGLVVAVGLLGGLVGPETIVIESEEIPEDSIVTEIVEAGTTFFDIASQHMDPGDVDGILASVADIYDLSNIVSGRELSFVYSPEGELKGLQYRIDSEEELLIERSIVPYVSNADLPSVSAGSQEQWIATRQQIPYTREYRTAEGVIESSLYESMIDNQIDPRVAIALSDVFAWQIDFALDIQKGDSFKVLYEERYLDGEYISPGRVLAAEFVNNGTTYTAYRFRGDKTEDGYYGAEGEALQKQLLKAPLQYKYISSGYTLRRKTPILETIGSHRAIDYAAAYGTPSVSVGDGTVVQAGWKKYYGISATIRHNEVYTTVYGHFQSLAKGIKVGAKVKQGQIIGYVGSTGLSTGPHLHYEVHKYGNFVNPLTIDVPPESPVAEEDMEQFQRTVQHLNTLAGW